MSSFTLKMLAVITMLIDHIGFIFYDQIEYYAEMRTIGRLAFPIFCFLLVEGVFHTRSKKRYLLRLAVFAVLSEIPFNLAFFNMLQDPLHQNVFWTLFIGAALLCLCRQSFFSRHVEFQMLLAAVAAGTAKWLHTDYGAMGVILIFGLYMAKEYAPTYYGISLAKPLQALWNGLLMLVYAQTRQMYAAGASIFMLFYNGKRGPDLGKYGKYAFYLFYPVHLIVLYLIHQWY